MGNKIDISRCYDAMNNIFVQGLVDGKERSMAISDAIIAIQKEKERLAEMLKNQIECPFCGKKFNLKDKK